MSNKMKSDIFDDYAKIMGDKGLVSLADDEEKASPDKPKESAKLKRYKKSPYPRMGSDDISTIEALYGVKPDSSIPYENNIMEAAHPKPVVVAPSYDRLNALVENEIERQNISCNIASKPNTGDITHHRYASKELMFELVRIANDMDNQDIEDLRKIADDCINHLQVEGLKKNSGFLDDAGKWLKDKFDVGSFGDVAEVGEGALTGAETLSLLGAALGLFAGPEGAILGYELPAFMTALRAGAGIGGMVAAYGKTPPIIKSVSVNAMEASNALNNIKKEITSDNNGQSEIQWLNDFQLALKNLSDASNIYLSTHKNGDDLTKSSNIIEQFIEKFNNKVNDGAYTPWISPNKVLKYTLYKFIDDPVENAVKYMRTLNQSMKKLKDAKADIKDAAEKIIEKHPDNQKPPSSADKPEFIAKSPDKSTGHIPVEWDENENEKENQFNDMIGHKPDKQEVDFFEDLRRQNK